MKQNKLAAEFNAQCSILEKRILRDKSDSDQKVPMTNAVLYPVLGKKIYVDPDICCIDSCSDLVNLY